MPYKPNITNGLGRLHHYFYFFLKKHIQTLDTIEFFNGYIIGVTLM